MVQASPSLLEVTESLSKYSDPITATGSLITFDAPAGGIFDSLSVPITSTQDLHGYDHPWPAGGGKNKLPPLLSGQKTASGLTLTPNADGSITISGTATNTSATLLNRISYANGDFPLPAGTYTLSRGSYADDTYVYIQVVPWSGSTLFSRAAKGTVTLSDTSVRFADIGINAASGQYINFTIYPQLENGSTATGWEPYENICPITGIDNLSVYVSPTTQQAQATTYNVSFGSTVYAGFVDPITGEVKERPQYTSYNGETLVGPWLSSMDEYAVDVTPTTGAQVVDLGGSLVTASITPVDISMREGSNNVWVDTSAVITLIYRLIQTDRKIDRTSIGKRAESLDLLGKFSSISKVEVNVTETLFYEAGDSSGRTLTVDCPFGTQEMADNLLAMLVGFYYQPYEARKAILDPAFEIGDGVTVGNVYGGIFSIHQKCGPLHLADLSAPADEEIDHEYKFTPAAERKIERRLNNMESELSVQAGEISAKVDRQGGDPSSVSWLMDSDVFKVAVDGNDVLTVGDNGLTINGDGNFTGEVHAKNIRYGGSSGTFSGGGISGHSIGTYQVSGGINTSLGNADYSADVFSGAVVADYVKANYLFANSGYFYYNRLRVKMNQVYYKDWDGNNKSLSLLGY